MIATDSAAIGKVSLKGVDCTNGESVRFCYSTNGCGWDSRLRSTVDTLKVDASAQGSLGGYMLFPGPGLMRLNVAGSDGTLATAVIDVPVRPST